MKSLTFKIVHYKGFFILFFIVFHQMLELIFEK